MGREDPLEKEMATHSSIFAWRIPWTEDPERLQGHKELDMSERLHFPFIYMCVSVYICVCVCVYIYIYIKYNVYDSIVIHNLA